jgi:DNA helicase-2/ATP-dependent DNA helicase PcrA
MAFESAGNLHLVLGGPGCGKTTRLLDIMESEIARGTPSRKIAFVAFTKAAADEAKTRAASKFSLDPKEDLPWFRTIHSLAYAALGIRHDEVMSPKDWKQFSAYVGEAMKGSYETESGLIPTVSESTRNVGDVMLRIVDYAGTTCQTLEQTWHELGEPIDWHRLKRFAATLDAYKREAGKIDFTDMLSQYLVHAEPLVGVQVAIIDEAQDLTRAQWLMVQHAFRNVARIYIGGDDDQAIYRWAGADVETFLHLGGTHEVLPLSHRLPWSIFSFAQDIVQRITHRFPKSYQPARYAAGEVIYLRDPNTADLRSGSWLLLARNGYLLGDLEKMCEQQGVSYRTRAGNSVNPEHVAAIQKWEQLRAGRAVEGTAEEFRQMAKLLNQPRPALRETQSYAPADFPTWPWGRIWHEVFEGISLRVRDYYVSCLRRGEKLTHAPRIRIDTIHGVKGSEADHVLLLSDFSARTRSTYLAAPDHEHRVFYVGLTRARHSLHLVVPQSNCAYDF